VRAKKGVVSLFGLTRIKGHVFIFIIVILHRFQMTWTAEEKKNKYKKNKITTIRQRMKGT